MEEKRERGEFGWEEVEIIEKIRQREEMEQNKGVGI